MTDPVEAEIDALFSGGLAPRTKVSVVRDGVTLFVVSLLSIECTGCGMRVPQSKSRPAHEARSRWVRDHLACRRAG
ncbi:hypothetical protein BH09MYX1_BH09MYX1_31700 [soil metagenome]